MLAPPDVPLHRTRAERFDDLVLQAVARLEPRWEAQLAGVEFGVEEIPPPGVLTGQGRGPVPLARLDPGGQRPPPGFGEGFLPEVLTSPGGTGTGSTGRSGPDQGAGQGGTGQDGTGQGGTGQGGTGQGGSGQAAAGAGQKPPRIVVYRRPLLARADSEDDLGELVFDVVVEEFAQLLGIDPEDVDPGYSGGE